MNQTAPSWLNVTAVTGFIVTLAALAMAAVGLTILARSGKGDMKKAASQLGTTMIGLVVLGMALITGVMWVIISGTVNFFVKK